MTGLSFKNYSKKLLKHNKWISVRNNVSRVRLSTYSPASPLMRISHTVVIINEADSLSRDAQAALRRTMEKYMSNMRIILCANSTSRLIAPIKSRCLLMRVAAPSVDEVRTYFPNSRRNPIIKAGRWIRCCNLLLNVLGLIFLQMPPTKSLKTRVEIFEKRFLYWKLWRCNRMNHIPIFVAFYL